MEIGIMSYDLAFHRPFLIDQNRWFNDLELRLECLDKLKEYKEVKSYEVTPVEIVKSLRIKCRDPRHIPKVRVFDADFRKVKIKIVDRPVSEIPTHKFWGKI